jgi:hypothetical protein
MEKRNRIKRIVYKTSGAIMSAVLSSATFALGFATNTAWYWLTALFFLVFVGLIYKTIYELSEKNDLFENARPKIVAYEPRLPEHAVSRIELVATYKDIGEINQKTVNTTTSVSGTMKEVKSVEIREKYTFVVVDFNNQPAEHMETSKALDVAAWITYYPHNNSKPLLEELRGRWWNKPEVDPQEDPTEKEKIDILPNRQKVTLALAFADGKIIYAYNNDSHKTAEGAKEFRLHKFLLGSDGYDVKVVLAGTHLNDDEHWFSLYINKEGRLVSNKIKAPR